MDQIDDQKVPEPGTTTPYRRSWRRIRIYLRELSVIIVGILITVMITGIVSNFSRQRELRGMLSRVTEELRQNVDAVNHAREYYAREQRGFDILKSSMDNILTVPTDTLEKYRFIIGSIHSLETKNDAYEVLKNSILTQYIRKKGLMTELSAAYGRLDILGKQLDEYSSQKRGFFYPMLQNLEPEEVDRWMNGSAHDMFIYPAADRGFRTFVIVGPTVIDPDYFDLTAKTLLSTISRMEGYGYK
ncbi:MAG: hypothetical protein LIO77_10770 [Rikenellaceae bacterium]|nr:hypothetical protein [Rikenellaceae bacterium]